MNPNRDNRPKDCRVFDCPFDPSEDAVCSNCGREKPKPNMMAWTAVAIGSCIGVPLTLLGACIVVVGLTGPDSNHKSTAVNIILIGFLIFLGEIALAISFYVKYRKK